MSRSYFVTHSRLPRIDETRSYTFRKNRAVGTKTTRGTLSLPATHRCYSDLSDAEIDRIYAEQLAIQRRQRAQQTADVWWQR